LYQDLSNTRSVIAISSKCLYRTLLITGSPLGTRSLGLTIVAILVSVQNNLINISRSGISDLIGSIVNNMLDTLVIVDRATPCELGAVVRREVICTFNSKYYKYLVVLLLVKFSKIEV
jgi:hypothetical protein